MARPVNTQLFEVVRNLDAMERTYVRRMLHKAYGKPPVGTLSLFDVLCKATSMNDTTVSEFLREYGTASASSQLKKYLYESILRHLRTLDAAKSARTTILTMLEDVTLLQDRALTSAAANRAQQALVIARNNHYHVLEAEILHSIVSLQKKKTSNDSNDTIMLALKQQEAALIDALELNQLTQLSRELRLLQLNIGADIEREVRRIAGTILLEDNRRYRSGRCQMWYHHCRSYIYHLLDDNARVIEEIEFLLEIVYNHVALRDEMHVVILLANKAAAQIELHDVEGLTRTVAELQSLKTSNSLTQEEKDENLLWVMCSMFLVSHDYHGLLHYAGKVLAANEHAADDLMIYLNIMQCVAWRALGDIERAIRHLHAAVSKPIVDDEFAIVARYLEILCHTQAGNRQVVIHKLRSLYRSLPAELVKGNLWRLFSASIRKALNVKIDTESEIRNLMMHLRAAPLTRTERSLQRLIGLA